MDVLYVRQSVDKKDSISIEAQIEMCAVQARGEYTVFADKGFSGKNTNRPAFKNMLSHIRNKTIDRIIVYRIDRLSPVSYTHLSEENKHCNNSRFGCIDFISYCYCTYKH